MQRQKLFSRGFFGTLTFFAKKKKKPFILAEEKSYFIVQIFKTRIRKKIKFFKWKKFELLHEISKDSESERKGRKIRVFGESPKQDFPFFGNFLLCSLCVVFFFFRKVLWDGFHSQGF